MSKEGSERGQNEEGSEASPKNSSIQAILRSQCNSVDDRERSRLPMLEYQPASRAARPSTAARPRLCRSSGNARGRSTAQAPMRVTCAADSGPRRRTPRAAPTTPTSPGPGDRARCVRRRARAATSSVSATATVRASMRGRAFRSTIISTRSVSACRRPPDGSRRRGHRCPPGRREGEVRPSLNPFSYAKSRHTRRLRRPSPQRRRSGS
jgi:hypothetical protein